MTTKHILKNSSAIASCDHDGECLHITFNSGSTHKYKDCPVEHFKGLKSAKSAGGYFHANIKGKFEEVK